VSLFRRALTEEQVVVCLTSDCPHTHLAKEFGCSSETIRGVRVGHRYKQVRPDLPRREEWKGPRKFCVDCIHCLKGKCSMDFPEAARPTYATICPIYERSPRTVDFRMELQSQTIAKATHELSAVRH
jgi:hypothetical protein